MKILGIDTTSRFLCIGIYENGAIYEYTVETGTKLSELITVTIKRILDNLGWGFGDVDYFACGLGPGSFTGTRIGVATMKGLGFVTQKPIIGIPSLDILAMNADDTDKVIIPAVDARRNSIYCAAFRSKNGKLAKVKPYKLLSEPEFLKQARPGSVMLGDALGAYKEKIQKHTRGITMLDKDYWYPKPRHLITLALEKIKAKKWSNAFTIKPIYLYPKDCQVRK